jgi:aspartyl-tRNA(Asn)/glutamyl-tRNA(Gln) amidotransferase subunit A
MTAGELRSGLHRGEWSCVEQTRALLEHAVSTNARLNAMTALDEDWVLAQARDADARLRRGERHDWLGLPVTAKDNLWIEGRSVSNGSMLFRDFVAPRDAVAVARLRLAGAVFLGSTICSEFACKGVTSNPLHGATRNPWDTTRTPGGSSGGAAAALAIGETWLSHGSDLGGSLRTPV